MCNAAHTQPISAHSKSICPKVAQIAFAKLGKLAMPLPTNFLKAFHQPNANNFTKCSQKSPIRNLIITRIIANMPLSKHQFTKLLPFILIPSLLGQIPPTLTFALNPNAVADIGLNAIPVPAWFFIIFWLIAYGCMGICAWMLVQLPQHRYSCVPLAILLAGYLQSHLFWFTDSLHNTAITDATGILLSATSFWVVRQYSKKAALWLLPWLVWMPITFALKIAAINGAFI